MEYSPLPRFPAITRDLAVVCDEGLPVRQIETCIRRAAGPILEKITLFDIYQGSQIEAGKKSAAFSLILRNKTRTLTDSEADHAISSVLSALFDELSATLRL